jgi:ribosomal protein S19
MVSPLRKNVYSVLVTTIRSLFKLPFSSYSFYKILLHKKICVIKNKNNTIMPDFLNKKVKIYTGRLFVEMLITLAVVGFKFGSFVKTRQYTSFKHN